MSNASAATSERLEIRMKSVVIGGDGEIGLVEQLLFDPVSGQTRVLVITSRVLQRPIAVPIDAVSSADGSAVRVGMNATDLNQNAEEAQDLARGDGSQGPIIRDRDLGGTPFATSLSTSAGDLPRDAPGFGRADVELLPLTAKQTVYCRDGSVGHIDLVLLEEKTRSATHIVVRCSEARRRDVIVPLWWVSEVTPERVVLDAAWSQLASCPSYRPDDEITGDVRATVLRLTALDPKDLWQVEVWTHDGIVELRGTTRTDWARATLERLTREINGVVAVRNAVEGLEELATANQEGATPTAETVAPVQPLVWNTVDLAGSSRVRSGPL